MTRESEYIALIAEQYKREGWEPLRPEAVSSVLNFEPDLVLKKDDHHLVIDVKEAGYKETRALGLIRKFIESNKDWKFELKIIPPDWNVSEKDAPFNDTTERLGIAKTLAKHGYIEEAFIISWISLEGFLREPFSSAQNYETIPISTLIRTAFEDEKLNKEQLRFLEACMKVRNRLVHGLSQRPASDDVDRLLQITSHLAQIRDREASSKGIW